MFVMYFGNMLYALIHLSFAYGQFNKQKVVLLIDVPAAVLDETPQYLPYTISDFTYAAPDTNQSITGKLQLGAGKVETLSQPNIHSVLKANNITSGHFGLWPFKNVLNTTERVITDDPYFMEQNIQQFTAKYDSYFITIINPFLSPLYLQANSLVYNLAWHKAIVACPGTDRRVPRSDCSREKYKFLVSAKNQINNRILKRFIDDGAYVVWMPMHGALSEYTDALYDANNPYRGGHNSLYTGGISGLMRYNFPNKLQLLYSETANGIDVAGTLLSLFGLELPSSQGVNLFKTNPRSTALKWRTNTMPEGSCMNASPQFAELRTINGKQYIFMYDAKRKEVYDWGRFYQFIQSDINFEVPKPMPVTSIPGCEPYKIKGITNGPKPTSNKPSIVLFLVDDVGSGDYMLDHPEGKNYPRIPNIKSLREGGVVLNNLFTSTICSPTRSALMNGRMPEIRGVYAHTVNGKVKNVQPPYLGYKETEYYMSTYFKALDYVTLLFGKCHWYDPATRRTLSDYHFDIYKCQSCYAPSGNMYDIGSDQYIRHSSEIITNDTLAALNTIGSRPFFLYLAYSNMHAAFAISEAEIAASGLGHSNSPSYSGYRTSIFGSSPQVKYNAKFTDLDKNIGRVLAWTEVNRPNNNIVIFASDNSAEEYSMFKYSKGDKGNERGQKRSNYAATLPVIIKYGSAFKGSTNVPAAIYDIFPTIVGLTGNNINKLPTYVRNDQIISAKDKVFHGVDLSACLYDEKECHKFDNRVRYLESVATSQVAANDPVTCLHSAPRFLVQWGDYHCYADSRDYGELARLRLERIECYNKSEDQLQTNNLALDRPSVVQEFRRLLYSWPDYNPQYVPRNIPRKVGCTSMVVQG